MSEVTLMNPDEPRNAGDYPEFFGPSGYPARGELLEICKRIWDQGKRNAVLAECERTKERTTIGLLADSFVCAACGITQPREKYAGGVWCDGKHQLFCTDHG